MPVKLRTFSEWFEETYQNKLGPRAASFKMSLSWLLDHEGKVIVETGCMREVDNWRGDGGSTLLFAEVASTYELFLWTVDNSSGNLAVAMNATSLYSNRVIYKLDDSVEFLKNFHRDIDFLYLDSLDCHIDLEAAQKHQLQEIKAAHESLSEHAVILLDDNNYPGGGKTKLTNQFLRSRNWRQLLDAHQAVWVR